MVILHISGLSGNKSAGPNINVSKNIEYGSKYANVALYNMCDNYLNGLIDKDKVFLMKDYPKISDLPKPFNHPDIVVFQSMYIKPFIKIYKEIKKNNIPYIITPRGSLTKAAQNKKKLKKIIGNILFFNKFIKNATSINFLTINEYKESKKFSFKNYYINGNGVDKKNKVKKYDDKRNKFIVTFIGRVEWYHKGLDYLIEAINLGKEDFRKNNFIFNIYGPDDFNSYKKLKNMISNYNIEDLINIYGPIFDKDKEKVILNSDLFIHTSRLEGQPTSVIEAISYGVPVFVTPGTNIYDVVKQNQLGFVSEFDIKKIKDNLLKSFNNKDKFKTISRNEINYSMKYFDWNIIIKKNMKEYKKVIKGD